MKLSYLSAGILLCSNLIFTSNLYANTLPVKTKKHSIIKLLTKNSKDLNNPYYQIKFHSIRELTNEEALMYELKLQSENISDLSMLPRTVNNITIPGGVPGTDGGFVGNNNGNSNANSSGNNSGLNVGTGAGGTITGGFGQVTSTIDGILMIVDKLIAIGEKIIPNIEKGRPVVTNKPMSAISVLPRIDGTEPVVHDMADWTLPVAKHYQIKFTNGFGGEAVSFVYSISYQYNGTYNGKGHYLAGVRMAARDIIVNWGFDLDASSQLIQISNVGTKDNVIAGATIEITYTVKNMMRNLTTSESFHVTGDGRLYKLD